MYVRSILERLNSSISYCPHFFRYSNHILLWVHKSYDTIRLNIIQPFFWWNWVGLYGQCAFVIQQVSFYFNYWSHGLWSEISGCRVARLSRSCLFSCTGPVLVAPSAVAVAIVQDIIAYHWLEYHLNRQNIVVHLNSILDSVSPWLSSADWHLYRLSSDTSVQPLSNATSDPNIAVNSKVKGHLWLSFKLLQPTSTDKASLIPWSTPGPLRLPQSLVDCPTQLILISMILYLYLSVDLP